MGKFSAVLLLAIMFIISTVIATDAPAWTGNYVNDYAGILDKRDVLEAILRNIETNITAEFAVVTISKLPSDETIETYSYKIFNTWGIGKKSENNGLLLLMTANGTPGSRLRLEVGYGLEGYITDSAAGRILDDALPSYEEGNYSQAAYIVVSDIRDFLEGKYVPSGESTENSDLGTVIFFIFMLFPIIFVVILPILFVKMSPKCPKCGSRNLDCDEKYCRCKKCGHKFKRKKRRGAIFFFGPGFGSRGGGFGGGGFGGGGGGGGGASR